MSLWTPDQDQTLIDLKATGLTASQIVAQMKNSLTRNAVIGRLHRLGIKGGGRPWTDERREKFKVPKPDRAAPISLARVAITTLVELETPVAVIEPEPEPKPHPVMAITNHSCRWPIGDPREPDFRFCTKTRHGSHVYCADHCYTAYPKMREQLLFDGTVTPRARP
jgi:GcrA cell cycle regulator